MLIDLLCLKLEQLREMNIPQRLRELKISYDTKVLIFFGTWIVGMFTYGFYTILSQNPIGR